MAHIPNLSYNCRTTETHGTAESVLQTCQGESSPRDGYFSIIVQGLNEKTTKLKTAINRAKSESEKTEKDEIRDDKITALYYFLSGYCHHPTPEIRNAAQLLFEIFENYGLEIKKESFTAESSLVRSLLADYAQPEAQAAIEAIPGCSDFTGALIRAQADFETTEQTFAGARAQEGTQANASVLKREVLNDLNHLLISYLNVVSKIDEPTFGSMGNTIREIISNINETVKRRKKKEEDEVAV